MQTALDVTRASAPRGLGMRFLRRNQYLLFSLAVLLFGCVMVLKQFMANDEAHFELREDLILLQQKGEVKACERVYQSLVEKLPDVSEKTLLDDLQRTTLLLDSKSSTPDNFIWKYHVSVKNELQRRAEQRLSRALQQSDKQ